MLKLLLKILGGVLLVLVVAIAWLAVDLRANIPADSYRLRPVVPAGPTVRDDGYLVFGATRNTGLMVATLLRERGEKVTAFARETSDLSGLQAIGAELVFGDALDPDAVRAAFDGKDYRAVVTTIGCLSCDPPPDFEANRNVIDAAAEAGTSRFLLVTTIGAGDSHDALPWLSRKFLARTLPLKTRAEEHLRESGLDYTIIRPGGLRSDHSTDNVMVTENRAAFGFIFREDLARVIVDSLDDPGTIEKTLAALDRHRAWPWSNE